MSCIRTWLNDESGIQLAVQPQFLHLGNVKVRHIIVTGPESSGKSTLAQRLAKKLNGLWIPEYPRGYLEAAGRKVLKEEFSHFVKVNQQLVLAAKAQLVRNRSLQPLIFQDTGLEILKLWMEDKFESASSEVSEAFYQQSPDYYFLCKPDLPWEYDPLREDPHRRKELYIKLRDLISAGSVPVVTVKGQGKKRADEVMKVLTK